LLAETVRVRTRARTDRPLALPSISPVQHARGGVGTGRAAHAGASEKKKAASFLRQGWRLGSTECDMANTAMSVALCVLACLATAAQARLTAHRQTALHGSGDAEMALSLPDV
jgi:hypothetical protein